MWDIDLFLLNATQTPEMILDKKLEKNWIESEIYVEKWKICGRKK